jgi:hypothetical protein
MALVKTGLRIGKKAEIADARMGDQEGQSNLAQATERPVGRPFNPGVPKASGPRKGRKARFR